MRRCDQKINYGKIFLESMASTQRTLVLNDTLQHCKEPLCSIAKSLFATLQRTCLQQMVETSELNSTPADVTNPNDFLGGSTKMKIYSLKPFFYILIVSNL